MKAFYILLAIFVIASVGFAAIDKPAPCQGYGDVNNDAKVTETDKQWVLEYIVRLRNFDSDQLRRANVDLDSDVDSVDALKIDRYVQGMDPTLPGCTERPPCSNYGDVNRDSYVTYKDSDIVLQYAAGRALLDEDLKRSADVDIDGDIDSADALKIQRYADNLDSTFTACNSRPPPCGSYGDVNSDGVVRADDAELVLRHVAGLIQLSVSERVRANVDGDADIDSVDALKILRYVSGMDNTFAVCQQTTTTSSTTILTTTTSTTVPCGYLKIFKFNDPNANNIWEQGETPLPGFVFDIHGAASISKTTGSGGVAITDCVPIGQYVVAEDVPAGWQLTSSNNKLVNVNPGILSEVRFGNRQVPAQTTSTIMVTTTVTMPPATTTTLQPTTTTTQPSQPCQNECSFWGRRECGGNNDYRVCGNFDSDSCFDWSQFSSCGAGKECVGGFCFPVIDGDPPTTTTTTTTTVTTTSSTSSTSSTSTTSSTSSTTTTTIQTSACSNECNFWGQRACDGSNTRVCGNFDSDNCFEWRSAGGCNSDQTCVEGYCFPRGSFYTSGGSSNASCSNECNSGERRCNGNNVEICGNYDSDSCYEWRFDRYCTSDQTCRSGDCSSCRDECGPQGLTDCNGPSIYMLCGNFDADPCNEWFSASCGRGEVCSGRRCVQGDSYPTPPETGDDFGGSTRTIIEQPVIQLQPVVAQQGGGIDPIMLLILLIILLALGAGAYFYRDRLGSMGAQISGEKEETPTAHKPEEKK